MIISAYQVNNVLRVYRDQFRHGRILNRTGNEENRSPDRISISIGGKQKALIEKITSNIAEKITQVGNEAEIGQEAFKEIEDLNGGQPDTSQKGPSDLIFKVINAGGETIRSFSVDDPESLVYKLITSAYESHYNDETESEA
jgi:hypothetical protein